MIFKTKHKLHTAWGSAAFPSKKSWVRICKTQRQTTNLRYWCCRARMLWPINQLQPVSDSSCHNRQGLMKRKLQLGSFIAGTRLICMCACVRARAFSCHGAANENHVSFQTQLQKHKKHLKFSHGNEALLRTHVFEWFQRFSEGPGPWKWFRKWSTVNYSNFANSCSNTWTGSHRPSNAPTVVGESTGTLTGKRLVRF